MNPAGQSAWTFILTPKNKSKWHFRSKQWTSSRYQWSVPNTAWYASSIWDQQHILINPLDTWYSLFEEPTGFQCTHCHPAHWFYIGRTKVKAQNMSNRQKKGTESDSHQASLNLSSNMRFFRKFRHVHRFRGKLPTCPSIFRWKLKTSASIFRRGS